MFVPVSKPNIGEEEIKNVNEAMRAGHISGTSGKFIEEFENKFAAYCGVKYGVAVSNGTVALHLALATLDIGKDDEVLVSTFTNMAPVFAILYQGAMPVPIDIEEDTWNLNPGFLEAKITPKTKAILVVHVYGHPADMDPILAIAKKHNLFVIEDAAEAHGAEYKNKRVGAFGDISCFSFYANKIITTGEGGMLVANNKEYVDKARSLRSLAYGRENRFMHEDVGFNYRMSNLQAAIGVAQLAKADNTIQKKRQIAEFYKNELSGIKDLRLPVEKDYAKNVYWMYHVVLRGSLAGKRETIRKALQEKGVETRESFVPGNMQKIFIERGLVKSDDCPVANYIGANGFYLPSGPDISREEMKYVTKSLRETISQISNLKMQNEKGKSKNILEK